MKMIIAISVMYCISMVTAFYVGHQAAEIAEKHFNEVNKAFEEAGL
jgi:hypothetical protein